MIPADTLLYGLMITNIIEGIARVAAMLQKMQNGEPITDADLEASKQETNNAMNRLEAAVAARKKENQDE